MKALGYSPQALADLAEITRFISRDDPDRAVSFVAELRSRALRAAESPTLYPRRDDLSKGLRYIRHGRYSIYFRDLALEVRVIRVAHQSQNVAAMFR